MVKTEAQPAAFAGRSQALPLKVTGLGLHLPPEIETAEDLAGRAGRSADWIRRRTGVVERRVSRIDVSTMAALAGREALGEGPPPDLVINASLSPAQLIPDGGAFVLRELGLTGIPAFSVHATCLGFLAALDTASALLGSGRYRRILVVAAERGTVCRDWEEPESAVLIGDGAAAAVLEQPGPGEGGALLAYRMRTFPEGAHLAEIRGFGSRRHPNDPQTSARDHLFHMDGPKLYRFARQRAEQVLQELLAEANLSISQIDLVVPHQASGPALAALPRMGFSPDRIVDVIGRFGNCISASLPMALAEADRQRRLKRGDTVLLLGTGAGVSVAGALLRW